MKRRMLGAPGQPGDPGTSVGTIAGSIVDAFDDAPVEGPILAFSALDTTATTDAAGLSPACRRRSSAARWRTPPSRARSTPARLRSPARAAAIDNGRAAPSGRASLRARDHRRGPSRRRGSRSGCRLRRPAPDRAARKSASSRRIHDPSSKLGSNQPALPSTSSALRPTAASSIGSASNAGCVPPSIAGKDRLHPRTTPKRSNGRTTRRSPWIVPSRSSASASPSQHRLPHGMSQRRGVSLLRRSLILPSTDPHRAAPIRLDLLHPVSFEAITHLSPYAVV